jgi:glycosyltransferase involved in cell wall biosynthesis
MRVPHRVLGMDRAMDLHDRKVAAYLLRQGSDIDIVHCWPGAALHTANAAAELGVCSVREVPNTHTANAYEVVDRLCRALEIELPPGHSHRMNAQRLRREEHEYEACFRLLVPSDHVMSTFLERGTPPEKLIRHQYGFDPETFTPGARTDAGGFHAVFLGGVEPRKGLHVALEAWRRSRAYSSGRLSIYGRVVDEYRPAIEGYLNLPNVELYDFTSSPANILRSADVLLLPSFEEGSALVTYEAQGCGAVPIVSSAAGAQCQHGLTGLIHKPGDVNELAQQLALLINEPELLSSLRRNVLAQRNELTWSAAAIRLEECYEQALEAKRLLERIPNRVS